ncbi:hypothetical protein [Thermosulfurimonas sp. F29]|uniref:hypothetical protein n=1 Tax=Thermosulfurimonas sp. F29 TaxID=2867247 RepID=UPI001C8343CC|nr:hypothetical protein [Thermosulfurimonas sp. F29]MBX6423420.1 hypothetical protein [Thermosulfurimonas sp. F29]
MAEHREQEIAEAIADACVAEDYEEFRRIFVEEGWRGVAARDPWRWHPDLLEELADLEEDGVRLVLQTPSPAEVDDGFMEAAWLIGASRWRTLTDLAADAYEDAWDDVIERTRGRGWREGPTEDEVARREAELIEQVFYEARDQAEKALRDVYRSYWKRLAQRRIRRLRRGVSHGYTVS